MVLETDPLVFSYDERRAGLVRILSPIVLFNAIAHLVVRQKPGRLCPSAGVTVADRPGTGLKMFGVGQLEAPPEHRDTDYYLTRIGAFVQPIFHHVVLEHANSTVNIAKYRYHYCIIIDIAANILSRRFLNICSIRGPMTRDCLKPRTPLPI